MKQVNLLESTMDVQLFDRTPRGLTLTNAGKSFYQNARYMIRYAKESQIRAKNAMQDSESILRMGTSIMTPNQFLMELWPEIRKICPKLKFEMVNFENTHENAREILRNPGQNIDIIAGIVDERLLQLPQWAHIHPLLKIIPVDWSHAIPFGLLHATSPSLTIKEFLAAAAKVLGITAT